ncbi:hypothetical protein ElyMa_006198900 [Elysia marginata]|uniref:Uncharacterized protein n=1 Tax=Elysia marginata TaxID=1093978 RepID=A0AAV4H466_9GAST|nr:hypothetical protein ElyMa_006198900 [Elysia marginata]
MSRSLTTSILQGTVKRRRRRRGIKKNKIDILQQRLNWNEFSFRSSNSPATVTHGEDFQGQFSSLQRPHDPGGLRDSQVVRRMPITNLGYHFTPLHASISQTNRQTGTETETETDRERQRQKD